jgi:predicted XRE-type DNA-binding protein
MARIRMQRSSGNLFRDIGFPRGAAVNLQIRSQMMIEIEKIIEERGLTQSAAADILGVTQPRVSDLVRGNIEVFSIDTLVEMLDRFDVSIKFSTKRRKRQA